MHAIHRTAPMPRPCVGVRVAGEAAAPSEPLRPLRSFEPSGPLQPSEPPQPSEPLEPFDWAVEEPAWSDDAGPATTVPDWWLRDRPILTTPPATSNTATSNTVATRTAGPDATAESATAARVAGLDAASEVVMAAQSVGRGTATGAGAAPRSVGHDAGRTAGDRGVRLTRRGRLVVVGLAAALLLGAFWIGTRAVSAASTTAGTEVAYVQNGDTLWAVAERVRPGVDPRDTVAAIRDLNGLKSTLVQPGQRLILPAR